MNRIPIGSHKISVTLVETMGNSAALRAHCLSRLSQFYGGATASPQQGAWVDAKSGALITESGETVSAYFDGDSPGKIALASARIRALAEFCFAHSQNKQDAIIFTVDDTASLITD